MKIWIGKDEMQIIKVEATAIRPAFATHPVSAFASMGSKTSPQDADKAERSLQNESTGAYQKGTLFVQQWQKLNNQVWLPKRSYVKGTQVYSLPMMPGRSNSMTSTVPPIEEEVLYSDFKKFHVATRILPGSDQ